MDSYITSTLLGVVEGLTEFLPISSTGHLIIVGEFLGFEKPFADTFDIVIQLGAILSVVIYFWKQLVPPLTAATPESKARRKEVFDVWFKAGLAVIPALVLGAAFAKIIKEHLMNSITVAVALLVGGVALIVIERKKKIHRFESVTAMPYLTCFWVGVIQCMSMIPGTSRAAATIIGALLLGASRKAAAEFSFFLAIPTMCAASGYMILKHGLGMSAAQWGVLAVGFGVSFVVALGVIAFLMDFIKKRTFEAFGYYRIALALAVLGYFYLWR